MHEVWLEFSKSESSNLNASHPIYARTRSEMYKKLVCDAETDLKVVIPEGIGLTEGEIPYK